MRCPGRFLRVKITTFLLAFTLPSLAAEWHVDPAASPGGDGSETKPFATLPAAVAAMPEAPAEPLTIHLAKGAHRITKPLAITPRETRGKPLNIQGEDGSVISGGKCLTNWRVEDNRWIHDCPDGPVRELFVNGQRAPRSRYPAEGWLRVNTPMPDKRSGFTAERLPGHEAGLELLFLHDWSISRIPVASIEAEPGGKPGCKLLKTTGPIGFPANHYKMDHFEKHPRFCLENGVAFLTNPGSWCYDPGKKQIIYLPKPGETPDKTGAIIPSATKLLRIAGEPGKRVTDIRLENIFFHHCRWDVPPKGYAEGQATKHVPRDQPEGEGNAHGRWQFVPWAVEVELADRVVFNKCRFQHLGGSGVLLGRTTIDCKIESCHVSDVSGNGIGIGEGAERKLPSGMSWISDPEQVACGNFVTNCLVEHCGMQFHGAVGIWAGLVKNARIIGNEVRHLPYTGISVGWMWNPSPTPCAGNRVEGNHIHHVMQILSDGGGIYTLGRQPGTSLSHNHIHDVPLNAGRAESNGMFLDEGSSEFTIEGNLIHLTVRSPLRFHKAGRIDVHHNTWTLPKDTPELRFNNTPKELIHARDNMVLDPAAIAEAAKRWQPKKP
jgi:hypothetical protein